MDIKVFHEHVSNPEGPVSLADGSWLITEMDAFLISQISTDGVSKRPIAEVGLPNGLAVDRNGDIWVADAKWQALLKVSMAGEVEVVSKGSPEHPFLLPNDLCFGPDGMLYMTDSGIALEGFRQISSPEESYDLDYDGKVFRIDPRTGECEVLARGYRLTNGIAISPLDQGLYVAETLSGNIYRLSYGSWEQTLFGSVMTKPPREYQRVAGPDGMACDESGYLYVAVLVQGDITILNPEGEVAERIKLEGDLPTNVAFDINDQKTLLVTEASKNQLLKIITDRGGAPLYY